MHFLRQRALNPEQLALASDLQHTINQQRGLDLKLGLDYEPFVTHETPWHRHHLIVEGPQLIAYGSILGAYHMPELNLMVHPGHRRQGLGTRLLRQMVQECQVRRVQKVLGICENASAEGQLFLQKWNTTLDFAEHRMVRSLGDLQKPEWPEGVTICTATPEDAESIAEGALQDFQFALDVQDLRRELEAEPEPHKVLKIRGKTVANLRVFPASTRAGIYAFRVHPAHRRQGLGELLMLQVMHDLQEEGYQQVWLEVNSQNPPAIRLYQKLGFETTVTYGYHLL